jgi:hypothetical protein
VYVVSLVPDREAHLMVAASGFLYPARCWMEFFSLVLFCAFVFRGGIAIGSDIPICGVFYIERRFLFFHWLFVVEKTQQRETYKCTDSRPLIQIDLR